MEKARARAIIAAVLLALTSAAVAHGQDRARSSPNVVVERSSADELVVTVRPRSSITRLDEAILLPRVEGAVVVNAAAPGEPMRLELRLPIAVPGAGAAKLEIVRAQYGQAVTGRVAPVPAQWRDGDGVDHLSFDAPPPSSMTVEPATAAEIRYLGIAQDLPIAHIVVHPVRRAPSGEGIESLDSITLRVRFASVDVRDRATARQIKSAGLPVLNPGASHGWRVRDGPAGILRRPVIAQPRALFRFEVTEDGLYALSRRTLESAGVSSGDLDAFGIAIYGGAPDLPEDERFIDSNRMRPLPVIEERDGEGRLERVLFHATGVGSWQEAQGDSLPRFGLSPYVRANSYILAIGAERSPRLEADPTLPPASGELTWGIGRVAFEEDLVNAIDVRRVGGGSGRDWYGTEFLVDPAGRQSDRRTFEVATPGILREQPAVIRIRVANAGKDGGEYPNRRPADGTFRFDIGGSQVGVPVIIQGLGQYGRSNARTVTLRTTDGVAGAGERLAIGVEFTNPVAASGFLDRIEVHYVRSLGATNDHLSFDAPGGTEPATYRAAGFSSDDLIGLDVSDPHAPRLLTRLDAGPGIFSFNGRRSQDGSTARYSITSRSKARNVERLSRTEFGELRGRPRNAELIVITHEDLLPAARRLVDYRNAQGRVRADVVTTTQIFNEYSHGNLDPTAIRDYLGEAFRAWATPPRWVLFLGDATYDYRNIATRQKPLVPTYQTDDGDYYDENASAAFDDYMLRVDGSGNRLIDIAHGRIPVETLEQANQVVDKIIAYEKASYGAWRHTIILAADDELPPNTGDGFAGQSEWLDKEFISDAFDIRKIYLGAYPTEFGTGGARKPQSAADLRTFVDRGALITNWIGHGNPKQWAHELLLEKDLFIPQLRNDSVLTFVTAATCNFGLYDDPNQLSGGEMFLLKPGGGAVAVMSASRASYIYQNEMLVGELFSNLFAQDPETGAYPTVGEIMMRTKVALGNGDNEEKYHIFGDPSMLLNMPPDAIVIDSINGIAVDDISGEPAQLKALSVARVAGSIRSGVDGGVAAGFDGRATVALYDADRTTIINDGRPLAVTNAGGRLYRGSVPVVDGRFNATFRIPRDIAFDSARARLHVYARADGRDAVGATRDVIVFGADSLVTVDTVGPVIRVYLDDRSFRSGDVVSPRPTLLVDASDDNGVNVAASQIGRGLTASLDDGKTTIDLSEVFLTDDEDASRGTAQRLLEDLSAGRHTVRVRAWDIFNNVATASAEFEIVEGGTDKLTIAQVVNYPNPFAGATEFTFLHNQARPLDVEVAIYTVAGRRIRTLEARGVVGRLVRIPWNGTDDDGAPIANGVYLYRLRVSVAGAAEQEAAEVIERLVIMR